jgi:hypothetical protein
MRRGCPLDARFGPVERFVEEIGATGFVQQLFRDRQRLFPVTAQVDHVLDQVAWMTRTHFPSPTLVVLVTQVIDDRLIKGDTVLLAHHEEDGRELFQ